MKLKTIKKLCSIIAVVSSAMAGEIATDDLEVSGTVVATRCDQQMHSYGLGIEMIETSSGRRWSISDSVGMGYRRSFYTPCFSPKGGRIAVVQTDSQGIAGTPRAGIVLMNNDGSNVTRLCELNSPEAFQPRLSWATYGYIYWSEGTRHVYRVDTRSGMKDAVCNLAPPSDIPDENSKGNVYFLSVARDGKHATSVSNGIGSLFALDLATCSVVNSKGGGCRGTISPDGTRIVHPITLDFPAFPGGEKLAYIERFDDRSIIANITAPEVKPFEASNNSFFAHMFSQSSNNYVLCMGGRDLKGRAYVYDIRTNTYTEIGKFVQPWDLWLGTLPVPVMTPVIEIEPQFLSMTSKGGSTPSPQIISVRNSGIGELTDVDITIIPDNSWLRAVHSGSGNTQTIEIHADPSGLDTGAHFGTVTISEGDASNSVACRIAFNIDISIMPPTELQATKASESSILLTWLDNADNESGFVLERRSDQGLWKVSGTTSADRTWLVDEKLTSGMTYVYRVRAVAGTDSSSWSAPDSLELSANPAIKVLYPYNEATLAPGSTQRIGWSTVNVSSVSIEYSLNNGRSWKKVTVGKAVLKTDSLWNNYPWIVPDTTCDSARIRISRYDAPDVQAISGRFRISSVGITPRPSLSVPHTVQQPTRYIVISDTRSSPVQKQTAGKQIRVFQLDGTFIGDFERNTIPKKLGNGCYIIEMKNIQH